MVDFNINDPASWALVMQEASRRGPAESAAAQRAYQEAQMRSGTKSLQASTDSTSTATSTTTTQGPYSADQLKGDADRQIAAANAFTAELQKAITSVGTTGKNTAEAVRKAGEAQSQATMAAGESAASAAQSKIAARDLMQAATGDPNGDLVKMVARRHDSLGALTKLQDEIAAADSVNVLDDPLGYLLNMVRVPHMKRAYNQIAMKVNTASRVIDTLEQQTQMQQAIDNGVLPTQERAAATARAEAERLSALARASELTQQTRIQQVQLASLALQQAGVPLEAHLKVFGALATRETTQVGERQGETLSRADRDLMNSLVLVNAKRISVGQPEYSLTDFKLLDGKQRDLLVRNGQTVGLAASPGEFYRVLSANGGLNTLEQAAPQIAQFMRERQTSSYAKRAGEELRNIANGGQKFSALPLEEQNEKILDKAMELELAQVRGDDRNYSAIDSTSALHFRKIAAARNPDLQNNWVSKFVAEQVQKDPSKLTNNVEIKDQRLLDELTGRVVAAQANGNKAEIDKLVREFSDFYRKGQTAQWTFGGAMQLGYPKPNEYVMRHNDHTAATGRGLQVWNESEVLHSVIMRIRSLNSSVNMFQIGQGYVSPTPFMTEPKGP